MDILPISARRAIDHVTNVVVVLACAPLVLAIILFAWAAGYGLSQALRHDAGATILGLVITAACVRGLYTPIRPSDPYDG